MVRSRITGEVSVVSSLPQVETFCTCSFVFQAWVYVCHSLLVERICSFGAIIDHGLERTYWENNDGDSGGTSQG